MKKQATNTSLFFIGGICAGFVNGLLGAGGGIIIVYLLSYLLKNTLKHRDIFANTLCVMFPISIVSCIVYALRGDMNIPNVSLFVLPAIIGGIVGGFFLSKINTSLLKKLFSALVVISGIILAVR